MKFEIELYEAYPHVCFYTVKKAGELLDETKQFFQRFDRNPSYEKDAAEIRALMRKMGNSRDGALEERFRFEDSVRALPRTTNNLRLYCIRCHSNTVILCNGGRKTSKKTKDSPDAYPHFLFAKQVEKLYRERIEEGSLENQGSFINGDRLFDTEL